MPSCVRRGRYYAKFAPFLLRNWQGAPIRFEFKRSVEGNTGPRGSFKRIRGDWLPLLGTIPHPTRTSLTVEQWGLRNDCSWTWRKPVKSDRSRRKLHRKVEWISRIYTAKDSPVLPEYAESEELEDIRDALDIISLKTEKRVGTYFELENKSSRRSACSTNVRWKHNKYPKCWQPRFVTKSTTRCCPVRRWPHEYHAASSAGQIRERQWRCSRRHWTRRGASSPRDGEWILAPRIRRIIIRGGTTRRATGRLAKSGVIRIQGRLAFTVSNISLFAKYQLRANFIVEPWRQFRRANASRAYARGICMKKHESYVRQDSLPDGQQAWISRDACTARESRSTNIVFFELMCANINLKISLTYKISSLRFNDCTYCT